jgi:excisionase family DNA binding protein
VSKSSSARFTVVSAARGRRLGELFGELEELVPLLSEPESLGAIGQAARLSALLSARHVRHAAEGAVAATERPSGEPEGLLTAGEAASWLGLPLPSFYRLVRRGEIPKIVLGTGGKRGAATYRFDPSDLRGYVAQRRLAGRLLAAPR